VPADVAYGNAKVSFNKHSRKAMQFNMTRLIFKSKSLPLLKPSVSEIDFGVVAAGGQKDASFKLTNRSPVRVEVAGAKTSCDCLRVELSSRSIRPAETVEARALLDLRLESNFTR
jgi:hypothetical protein